MLLVQAGGSCQQVLIGLLVDGAWVVGHMLLRMGRLHAHMHCLLQVALQAVRDPWANIPPPIHLQHNAWSFATSVDHANINTFITGMAETTHTHPIHIHTHHVLNAVFVDACYHLCMTLMQHGNDMKGHGSNVLNMQMNTLQSLPWLLENGMLYPC